MSDQQPGTLAAILAAAGVGGGAIYAAIGSLIKQWGAAKAKVIESRAKVEEKRGEVAIDTERKRSEVEIDHGNTLLEDLRRQQSEDRTAARADREASRLEIADLRKQVRELEKSVSRSEGQAQATTRLLQESESRLAESEEFAQDYRHELINDINAIRLKLSTHADVPVWVDPLPRVRAAFDAKLALRRAAAKVAAPKIPPHDNGPTQ